MRKIKGPIKNQDGIWKIRTNEGIDLLTKHAGTVRYIREQRIRWIGHFVRMDKERAVKRI